MNSCVFNGIVSNEIKLRNGSYGAFANSNITITNGERRCFIPVIAYGEMAEKLSRVAIGSKICVSGVLDTYKDNQDMYRLSVTIKDFEVVEGRVVSTLENKNYW